MSARKRVRFSDKVDEKHISEDEKHESEEEDDAEEDVDDKEPDEPTIVAGATMEDLISQLEPGIAGRWQVCCTHHIQLHTHSAPQSLLARPGRCGRGLSGTGRALQRHGTWLLAKRTSQHLTVQRVPIDNK